MYLSPVGTKSKLKFFVTSLRRRLSVNLSDRTVDISTNRSSILLKITVNLVEHFLTPVIDTKRSPDNKKNNNKYIQQKFLPNPVDIFKN